MAGRGYQLLGRGTTTSGPTRATGAITPTRPSASAVRVNTTPSARSSARSTARPAMRKGYRA